VKTDFIRVVRRRVHKPSFVTPVDLTDELLLGPNEILQRVGDLTMS